MTLAIPLSSVERSNYFSIVNRPKGEWLEADSIGRLHSVKGFLGKSWFVIRNALFCNSPVRETAKAVNQVCLSFFSTACDRIPLDSESPDYLAQKETFLNLAKAVERFPSHLYKKSLLKNIHDFSVCPEILEATLALESGKKATLVGEGISGTYILKNRRDEPFAIFKPKNEEAGNPDNPKGICNVGELTNQLGILPGTSYQRERAVYLLDREHFAGVPLTAIAKLQARHFGYVCGELEGSFQKYVPECDVAWEHYQILPSFLSNANGHLIPSHEIHKIAILDIRTLNADRHLKNFLVDKDWKVHPIDHGFTLPNTANRLRFNWMNFNQSKVPFSQDELNYIERLNPEEDIRLLKEEIPSMTNEGLFRLNVASYLLKIAARKGLTAYSIGRLMVGKKDSALEDLMDQFIPTLTDKPSFFETNICQPLLRAREKSSEEERIFLEETVESYIANNF